MRLFLEVITVGALLLIGWEKPFRHWIVAPPPTVTPAPEATTAPHSSAPAAKNWMWDRERTTPLDRGSYNRDDHVTRAPDIYYRGTVPGRVDQNGRRYWVDQSGGIHYY